MKRDEKALDRIISRISKEWQADGRKAVKRLYALLDKGKKTAEAIDIVRKEYPALFTLPNVQPALTEAAAYGYGIMPSVLTATQWEAWSDALDKPWDGSGMTLSKKLHGADMKMREAITDTIRDQLKRNSAWTEAAKALYDGYEHGNVVRPQQLPKYLSAVRYATQGSPEALAEARKVFYNIERLSKSGAPTKSLKAAYSSLVRAAQTGTEEQLEKACYVAVQEKSRYVAQRIIRTELSRAYSDGFNAKIMQDDDVVAVRLRLSSRHPVFDICNLFAEADMYGLGKGVYPKDKMPPVPLHPHCMCRYEEVYAWEVDISKQKDNVKQAGDKWLNGLSDVNRRRVLGIEGDEAWKQGENWQKYMRNWRGLVEAETRLKELMEKNLVPPTDEFIKTLADREKVPYTIGKKGNDRFYDDNGDPIYPPNEGFVGIPRKTKLEAGKIFVDRYGPPFGSYVCEEGTDYPQRALPKGTKEKGYTVFAVEKDIEDVLVGETAPWFGEVGGGIQYKLPHDTEFLLDEGYLKKVKP